MYLNVDLRDGQVINTWLDSLQVLTSKFFYKLNLKASFAGVQVLAGNVDDAICAHAFYYSIWKKYGLLPERFNWHTKVPDVSFYPLRPEFVESTYLLFLATRNPFYQHVGMEIIDSLNLHTRVRYNYL